MILYIYGFFAKNRLLAPSVINFDVLLVLCQAVTFHEVALEVGS